MSAVDEVVGALAAQHAELAGLVDGLDEPRWRLPTRCAGWDVDDVVLHLAQTDELALSSVDGTFDRKLEAMGAALGGRAAASVDEGAAALVCAERHLTPGDVLQRWRDASSRLVRALGPEDLSRRVPWVAGVLTLRTLVTTRVAETWIHSGDVAQALGRQLPPSDRLRLVARLAWRTLPYAFAQAGLELHGPVAFHLSAPDGTPWWFDPDGVALTTVSGPATDLCAVAGRRVDAGRTDLEGVGPDADAVLSLVRTYA